MKTRLSIVRTPGTLDVWCLEQRDALAAPVTDDRWPDRGAFVFTRAALDPDDPLAAACSRLAGPRALDAELLADLRAVLAHSIVDPLHRWPSAPALPDPPPPPPKPTAAHPRAYRGTRYRPPKPFTATVADARLHLDDGPAQRALLDRLGGDAPAPATPDPRWSAMFRAQWAPALGSAAAALYGPWCRAGLDRDGERAAVALALVLTAPADGIYWLDQLATLPPDARSSWAHALIGSGLAADGRRFDHPLAALHDAMAHRVDGVWRWAWLACTHRRAGGGVAYLLQGLSLCAPREDDWIFEHLPPATHAIDAAVMARFLERTAPVDGAPGRRIVRLWVSCGRFEGLTGWLALLDAADVAAPVASHILALVRALHDLWGDGVGPAGWTWLRPHGPRLIAAVCAAPPAQRVKAVDLLWDAVLTADDVPTLARLIERKLRLIAPVCAAGSPTGRWYATVPTALAETLDDAPFERLLRAPATGWSALADACRRKNTTALIELGAVALAAAAPDLLLDAMTHTPGPLWRTARLLGGMRPARGQRLVRALLADPLAGDWGARALDDLCAALAPRVGDGVPDPVPRALKRHLGGEKPLTAGQLARARGRLLAPESRLGVLLGLLRAAVTDELARAFAMQAPDDGVFHALQMLATIDDNRRILRRVLRARWRDGPDVVRTHPSTRRWWARHPQLDEAVWHAAHRQAHAGPPPLTLALESDPIEVLRMGTAVGSCLGLGGSFSYSAAAVVVDDNKRVIFARDPTGRIVARQLVALAEEGWLVPFYVYPHDVDPAVKRAFADFDHHLADALGVPLYDAARSDGYTVALILSHDWWDDDAMPVDSGLSTR